MSKRLRPTGYNPTSKPDNNIRILIIYLEINLLRYTQLLRCVEAHIYDDLRRKTPCSTRRLDRQGLLLPTLLSLQTRSVYTNTSLSTDEVCLYQHFSPPT